MPEAIAVATPGRGDVAGQNSYATCTFASLERDAAALARGLVELGIRPGMKLVLLVRPGVQFVKLVFALLRSGATTVLIDPGMGRTHLVDCLAAVEPDGFVAISPAQALRTLQRHRFPMAQTNVTIGRRWFWGGKSYEQLLRLGRRSQAELPATNGDDAAAIIFTSGSTGPPKGVLYSHRMFDTQAAEIQRAYSIHPGGADLACFPLFGLFNSAMGVTTVFPKMDFSRPASADPRKLLAAARDWQVTQAFASPAVWKKLGRYCEQHGERIPTLRKVLSCGAPVPASVLRQTLACVHPEAQMHTPYGATESLPISTISAAEVLSETARATDVGAGICVGHKYDSIDWRIIRITDEPIDSIDSAEELPVGEIGELIVRGPQVSTRYVTGPERHNQLSKIQDGDSVWHRLGDVGYFDEHERFWYCGRKAHRVDHRNGDLFTIPIESVFNTLPNVQRSALIGVGKAGYKQPVIVVELETFNHLKCDGDELWTQWCRIEPRLETLWYGKLSFTDFPRILVHRCLPTDGRHNSKINREHLDEWAAKQLANQTSQPLG